MNSSAVIARILAALMSLLDSANLRNRLYSLQQERDILLVAIADIERINAHSANPRALIAGICARYTVKDPKTP
jgi:hypothetical protein